MEPLSPDAHGVILMFASFALFALLFLLFFKLFPPVSIWEVSEGRVIEEAKAKIDIPMPEPSPTTRCVGGHPG